MPHSILAARSGFSVGESILDVEELVDDAASLDAKAVALTDTMSVTGLIDFTKRAQKKGIKPIIGCRLRLVDDPGWRKAKKGEAKQKTPRNYYVTWYCLSDNGLKALFKLLSLANSEERFYFEAKLGFDDLYDALKSVNSNDVAIASSDVYSVIHHSDAAQILEKIASALTRSNVFLTLSPIASPLFDTLNMRAIEIGEKTALPYLVTFPTAYKVGQDAAHEIMGAIVNNESIHSVWHKSLVWRDLHPKSTRELVEAVQAAVKRMVVRGFDASRAASAFAQGLKNTDLLVDSVSFAWKKLDPCLPQMASDPFAEVVKECRKGWPERFGDQMFGHKPVGVEIEAYKERLRYELEVLNKLKFSDYFLLVQDVVRFAKSNGILVGPGRGSVGGSLVAYLMGITECDPLRFGLLFERFINPDRIDLPDVDLDFMSDRRGEIIDYLVKKYGRERVAGVSNFMALGTASAIRDVSRVCGLPEREYNCSKYAPKEHGAIVKLEDSAAKVPEIAAFKTNHSEIWELCLGVEGAMRGFGQHAAGVVVAGCDLVERGVVERRKGESVVNWDKRIVEDQGLIKMDVLGLSTLDFIAQALEYIRERHSKKVNLSKIPLDDPGVLTLFAQGKTTGIFQFESGGMRRLLKELGKGGSITFDDITAATALYRPGPMESGMMDSYWKRKQGLEPVEYDHPLLEEILKPTFGVFVYQEQVMQAARTIAGYSAPDADKLRKIMGKKLPEEMKKERGKFVDGVIATVGESEEWAGALFDKIEGFAGYGFNKSHSVEYTLISYQVAWLKWNYPVEFFAAALSRMGEDKLAAIIAEANSMGIRIRMPDINLSTSRFEILTDTSLIIPFGRVKGLSINAANAIVEARKDEKTGAHKPFVSQADFVARVNRRLVNSAKVEILDKIGAFASIESTALPCDHPSRIKDQREFIPALVTDTVPIERDMQFDKFTVRRIIDMVREYREAHEEDGKLVAPAVSVKAKAMLIFDAPSTGRNSEESKAKMGMGDGFAWQCTSKAMGEVGFSINDFYITALLRRPKVGKQISVEEIQLYEPYLREEIDLIKPPLIIALGSQIVRWFFPDLKGKASDHAGKVMYHKGFDANVVIGFNPGEVWHDPDKQEKVDEIFQVAMSLTDI